MKSFCQDISPPRFEGGDLQMLRHRTIAIMVILSGNLLAEEPAPVPVPTPAPAPATVPGPTGEVKPPADPKPPVETKPATDDDITSPSYLIDLAQVHLNHGSGKRAEALVRKALELNKDDRMKGRATQLLAQVLERNQDVKGAAEQYDILLKGTVAVPERIQYLLALSSLRERNKETDKAIELLNEAAAAAKNSTEKQNLQWVTREVNRRVVEIMRKDPERLNTMIADAEKKLTENPKDEQTIERLAEIYIIVKPDPAKALPLQEQLAALRPDALDVMHRLASLYQQNKQPEKALEIYKKLQAQAPKGQQMQYAFQGALQLNQMGKKEEAVKMMEEAVGPNPTRDQDASMLATVYDQAGQHENAEKMLKQAAELTKRPGEKGNLLVRAADSARRRKDYAAAETQLRAVMKEFKDQKNVVDYAKSMLTQLYREQGKEKELKFDE
jgi:tetratricopeptide (TPR) repeat protein